MTINLSGRAVLIVEDEPLIALDIATAFERAGAATVAARTLADARRLVEREGLSAAVVDLGLADGDTDEICERLTARDVPFVLHSGYSHMADACRSGIVIPKPASPDTLIDAVERLLDARRH